MKLLIVGDIHGKHEILNNAFEKFEKGNYDKIILLGDLADSYDRTNEDILRCFKISIDNKEKLNDRMIWLWGNHDWQYLFGVMLCGGFRRDLNIQLNPLLNSIKGMLQIAYGENNYLFTHAGVQRQWLKKHQDYIDALPESSLSDKLNNMFYTSNGCDILYEVGTIRGGASGARGGPMWCDRVEMESYGPISGYHQVVGHTPVKFIEKINRFEGGKHYNNTSVTFIDCLDKQETFLTIETCKE